ncbi:MAG TPA: hypothetical protein VEF76_06180 [Patescibacteria group bacterium]|nr:hypothetical protein [Patescibacteria group bacterium]
MSELKIDRETMAKLSRSLAFIINAQDPTVIALKTAAESGLDKDIKQARAMFLKLKPGHRAAALEMLKA